MCTFKGLKKAPALSRKWVSTDLWKKYYGEWSSPLALENPFRWLLLAFRKTKISQKIRNKKYETVDVPSERPYKDHCHVTF
jgi:hypothetical protein